MSVSVGAQVIYLPTASGPPVEQERTCAVCKHAASVDGMLVCAVAADTVADPVAEAEDCPEYAPWPVGQ